MRYLYLLPAAFLAPVIHEWVKALVSTAQGDPSPKTYGYLTANPFKFFEPIGFLFIFLFGFGWGRPVQTSALHYKNRPRGVVLTYMIPVLVNLLLGVGAVVVANIIAIRTIGPLHYGFFLIFMRNAVWTPHIHEIAIFLLASFAYVNINLALFNLIPVFPLATNKLLLTFSSPSTIAWLNHYEKPMQVILVLLLALGIVEQVTWPFMHRIVSFAWVMVS